MTASSVQAFAAWLAFLGPTEGVLSLDPKDPGNWTSGKPGVGTLKGTKYGIAASSHPDIDIASLTLEGANQLRKSEYWDAISGDRLHPSVALMVADAAYGSGPYVAATQLQQMLGGIEVDGRIGEAETIPAVQRSIARPSHYAMRDGLDDLLAEYAARRLLFEEGLHIWDDNKGGWTRRLFRSVIIARALA